MNDHGTWGGVVLVVAVVFHFLAPAAVTFYLARRWQRSLLAAGIWAVVSVAMVVVWFAVIFNVAFAIEMSDPDYVS